ncbi:Ribosomal lysine N-methyltransferase 4 [Microbotryomycetes sp. JL221]|nr:Ribosomal lysine N-methyltransferase 4 [Microbotryomycetes sp. JL221]
MTVDSQTSTPEEAAFYEWLSSTGGDISSAVGLKQFDGMGRGAVALRDIDADELLFSISRQVLLTISNSSLPPLLPQEEFSELNGWTPLILCMMYESLKSDSTWQSYFALMPAVDSFSSLMWWNEEELKELQGSMVLDKVGKADADAEFENVVKPFVAKHSSVFGDITQYTLERFHWMGSLILSRSFHVESKVQEEEDDSSDQEDDDEEEEREDVGDVAMVPMADLLNARYGCDNARLFYEPKTLNMMSTKPIKKGEQIWNTYAEPPNSDLLRRYGHVDEDNGNDLVEVSLKLVADVVGSQATKLDDKQREERADFLLDCGIDDTCSIEKDLELPIELLTAIRTFILTEVEFEKVTKKGTPPKGRLEPDSAKWVMEVLKARLKEYPTVIEEDERLLQDQNLTQRKRMAVIVRLGEKRILRDTIDAVKKQIKELKEESRKKRKGDDDKGGRGKKAKSGR